MVNDLFDLKFLVLEIKLVRLFFEDIWLEIIMKDCVFLVLYLCYMGVLLEIVIGVNMENGLF